ncbi:unnamed protein product [Staurois parvus]|uniref:Uncharacterized protein n=1 Tax=Staurois parvus TaxID=386267 RepID=A0ABN9HBZ7_9NEOB|nr:unnamed protein product [Staurois parvus]
MPPATAHQCHISLPFSATYQCQSVPPINAANISASYQCCQ